MFKKILESTYKDYYKKFYDCDCSIYEAMDIIIKSGINFSEVNVSDKGDVGMKYFGGSYSFDDFIIIYDKIRLDIDTLSLKIFDSSNSIQISTDEKDITLLTKDQNLDLNDLLEKKKTL